MAERVHFLDDEHNLGYQRFGHLYCNTSLRIHVVHSCKSEKMLSRCHQAQAPTVTVKLTSPKNEKFESIIAIAVARR